MSNQQERRVEGIKRVPVEALVEVCGLREDVPAFEAESRNVSDRGIRLRTAYLPELGAPVVCRFESGGQEVLAEGVIAWCSPKARGGEFGVRFTALNSRSAQVLGHMCHDGEAPLSGSVDEAPCEVKGPSALMPAGTRVKLHIDGLSSPMRARVQQGDTAQISVNSSLEFLKIGKRLSLENVDVGGQTEAYIDGLDVVIDPNSGVPNLVVLLRSPDEKTPEPSIIETHREPPEKKPTAAPAPVISVSTAASEAPPPMESSENPADSVAEEVAAMRGKLEQSLSKVGLMMKMSGNRAASFGKSLAEQGGPMMQKWVRSWSSGRRAKTEPGQVRRRTSPPPSQVASSSERVLRPQGNASTRAENASPVNVASPNSRRKTLIVGAGASLALIAVIALASRGTGSPSSSTQPRDAANSQVPAVSIAAGAGVSSQSAPTGAAPIGSVLTAPVPLFGSTAMATLEPAPLLDPPATTPASLAGVAAREMAAAKSANVAVAAGSDTSEEPDSDKNDEVSKPEDVAPWGKGKMRDPIIYRVKLDGPGLAIQGHSFSKGFSVVIPKRKVLESPAGYAKQDKRLEKVTAANGDDGVKLVWRFKDEIPGYRVRLRKNTVEFLISSKTE